MSTKNSNAGIEEYEPGPGHPHTLDGYRDWCNWRNEQEVEAKARRLERERARGA